MSVGLLDLSIVTRRLIKQLTDCAAVTRIWDEPPVPLAPPPIRPPFTLKFSDAPPDQARKLDNCQVSLYLFHVAPDKFHRNMLPTGGGANRIAEQPFAITLYYLLSAHSKKHEEAQQAMSIALKCFHEHPTVSGKAPMDGRIHELTLTLEPQSVDEVARLWQSLATPLRLSAVYRVSVFFLEPETVVRTPDLVLRPHVDVTTMPGPPQPINLSATVTATGLATITGVPTGAGQDFSDSMAVQIGGHDFQPTTTNPPEPGRFCVVSATQFKLLFPARVPANPKGRFLLRVRLEGQPEATVLLVVP